MTPQEFEEHLRELGVDETTFRFAKNCYEIGSRQGWNASLDMAAFRLQHDFVSAFGNDTLSSIAVYIKEFKR